MAKAFVVAAPASGSGKTLVTLGLLRALKKAGYRVASAKAGPDYIDPQFHEAATGQPCITLDYWAMGAKTCRALLAEQSRDADFVIIEGVMGLFDGPRSAPGSTADLADALGLPIIMVVDASHQAQSVAALLHGFSTFRNTTHIAGVILNRVKSDRHAAALCEEIKLPVFGLLRDADSLKWPSRHLGLLQPQENQQLEAFIEDAAQRVSRETMLDSLCDVGAILANQPETIALAPLAQSIAVAKDQAFSFVYEHILSGWRKQGAELQFFSPLANEAVPKADAIYLPGGYPELHAGQLASNTTFLNSLKSHSGAVYGECGGYMVLGEVLTDAAGLNHKMAGLLPISTSFAQRKLQLGYRHLKSLDSIFAPTMRGHEFHYSIQTSNTSTAALFHASDAAGNDLGQIGARVGKVFGSYAHVIAAHA